jgi:integrase
MRQYKLGTVQFERLGGVKLQVVLADNEIDLFAGIFALQRYDSGLKPNSIIADQRSIQNLYRFCATRNIELVDRIAGRDFFKIGEIEDFSSYSGYSQKTGSHVDPNWYSARIRGAFAFIKFLWLFYQSRFNSSVEDMERSKFLYEQMEVGFKLYAKKPYVANRKDKVGLSPDLRLKLLQIIDPAPSNPLNPWKTTKVRWRNYILLLLLMLGGNRKGETLLLRLENFQLTGPRKYYDILKFSDAALYPRNEAPSVKTYGRSVVLHDKLASLIEYYIVEVRTLFLGANRTSYLFVSYRDGLPLSLRTPNAIINTLITKHREFESFLSPHRLRNTYHDLLNDALNFTFRNETVYSRELQKSAIQEFAGGWKSNSAMPAKYSRGSIQKQVAGMHKIIQDKVFGVDV